MGHGGLTSVFTPRHVTAPFAASQSLLHFVQPVVLYEVYKFLARTAGEETALRCVGFLQQAQVAPLDTPLALEAADLSAKYRLAMADAVVYATALRHHAELATSDSDLEGLPGVRFIPR